MLWLGVTRALATVLRVAPLGSLRTTGVEWPLNVSCIWKAPVPGDSREFHVSSPTWVWAECFWWPGLPAEPSEGTQHRSLEGNADTGNTWPLYSLARRLPNAVFKGQSPFPQCCLVASHLQMQIPSPKLPGLLLLHQLYTLQGAGGKQAEHDFMM